MKLTKTHLRRIIKEEKQKLFESGLLSSEFDSWSEVDEILAGLPDDHYDELELCAFEIAEAFGRDIDSDHASYIIAVLVKLVLPRLKNKGIV